MPASTFWVATLYPGQTPPSPDDTVGPNVVFVDYTTIGDDGGDGEPDTPTEGQLWPRGQGT